MRRENEGYLRERVAFRSGFERCQRTFGEILVVVMYTCVLGRANANSTITPFSKE